MTHELEIQEISVNPKNGGLKGKKHLNRLGICFGPATDLIGSHRGLAPTSSILIARTHKELE